MISLIQLVSQAAVVVDKQQIGAINKGILALIGLEKDDNESAADKMLNKILNYRIFQDTAGKTNLSLIDIKGGLLLVPQFTLVADTGSGTRPGFSKGMPPQEGKILFEYLVNFAKNTYPHTQTGQFGAYMQVSLCNDGPMTFILNT